MKSMPSKPTGSRRTGQRGLPERSPLHHLHPLYLSMPTLSLKTHETVQDILGSLQASLELGERLPAETLTQHLRHRNSSIRKLAIELLEYSNDPQSIPALLEAAADSDIEIGILASEVITAFRHQDAIPHLIEGLRHERAEVRLSAVNALRERRSPLAIDGLLATLRDSEPEVRRQSVQALAKYRRGDLVPALRNALSDESPAVRRTVVAAFADFESGFVLADVVFALNDRDWQVRREAAAALWHFPEAEAITALRTALYDSVWQVQREAALSLSRLKVDGGEEVAEFLLHELAAMRIASIIALAASGNPSWAARIEPLLNDPDPGVQQSARRALKRLASFKSQLIEL